jgi:hypothetical protein
VSKDNVALFLQAVAEDADLNQRLGDAERTAAGWVEVALDAGFELEATHLKRFIEDLLGRGVSEERMIEDFLAAQNTPEPALIPGVERPRCCS